MIFLQPSAAPTGRREMIVDEAASRAARLGAPVLACVTEPAPLLDPVGVYRRAVAVAETVSYWEQPRNSAMVAAGVAWSFDADGAARFAAASSAWKDVAGHAVGDVDALTCFGGFAFDAEHGHAEHWRTFGNGAIVVPEWLYRRDGRQASITRCLLVQPDGSWVRDALLDALPGADRAASAVAAPAALRARIEVPDAATWMRSVEALTSAIRSGGVEKVVLAREVALTAAADLDPVAALAALRDSYGKCTLFAIKRGDACFIGATPERLVRVRERRVSAACVAGSSRRGDDERHDETIGEALLADAKERSEHDLVLTMIVDALAPLCGDLSMPAEPQLMKMPNVQHLHTPIEGALRGDAGVLDLVARLHPTPAVGGVPREAALALIRQHEPFDRGWYAGPVGWMDARGNGEFVVALRSGLLRGAEARLYAGCGIVRDSVPAKEYEESMLKLRPMLCALNLR